MQLFFSSIPKLQFFSLFLTRNNSVAAETYPPTRSFSEKKFKTIIVGKSANRSPTKNGNGRKIRRFRRTGGRAAVARYLFSATLFHCLLAALQIHCHLTFTCVLLRHNELVDPV